jgi:hypothetical protein
MSRYYCGNCGHNTDVKANMNKHIKTKKCQGADVREEVLKVKCDICEKEFHTEFLLNAHKKGCFEKKTVAVPTYINKEEIDEEVNTLKLLIKSMRIMINDLKEDNKETNKRLEKLEQTYQITKNNRSKGFEILSKEQIDEIPEQCAKVKFETIVIEKYDDLLGVLDQKYFMQANTKAKVGFLDKTGEMFYGVATENGISSTTREGKDKKFKFNDVKIVRSQKSCKNEIFYRILKTDQCYCEDHFNPETGKEAD